MGFCVAREFVHNFHMAGIASEEGSEAFMAVLENVKDSLRRMPVSTGKAELMCVRTQGNTKEGSLNSKRTIFEA